MLLSAHTYTHILSTVCVLFTTLIGGENFVLARYQLADWLTFATKLSFTLLIDLAARNQIISVRRQRTLTQQQSGLVTEGIKPTSIGGGCCGGGGFASAVAVLPLFGEGRSKRELELLSSNATSMNFNLNEPSTCPTEGNDGDGDRSPHLLLKSESCSLETWSPKAPSYFVVQLSDDE